MCKNPQQKQESSLLCIAGGGYSVSSAYLSVSLLCAMVTERSMRTTETRLIKSWHHRLTRCICPQGSTQMSKVITLPRGRNEVTRQQHPALYGPSSCVFVFSQHQQRRKCTRCLWEKTERWKFKGHNCSELVLWAAQRDGHVSGLCSSGCLVWSGFGSI